MAVPPDFYYSMKTNTDYIISKDIVIPNGFQARAQHVVDNPVATVLEYQHLMYNLLTILVGIPPEQFNPMGRNGKKQECPYLVL